MAGSSNLARQGHTVRSLRQRGAQRPGHRRAARVRPGRSRRAGAAGRLSEEALPSAGRGVSANDLTAEFHFLRLAVGLTPADPICGSCAVASGGSHTRKAFSARGDWRGVSSKLVGAVHSSGTRRAGLGSPPLPVAPGGRVVPVMEPPGRNAPQTPQPDAQPPKGAGLRQQRGWLASLPEPM